jgi:hypothetical protein
MALLASHANNKTTKTRGEERRSEEVMNNNYIRIRIVTIYTLNITMLEPISDKISPK